MAQDPDQTLPDQDPDVAVDELDPGRVPEGTEAGEHRLRWVLGG